MLRRWENERLQPRWVMPSIEKELCFHWGRGAARWEGRKVIDVELRGEGTIGRAIEGAEGELGSQNPSSSTTREWHRVVQARRERRPSCPLSWASRRKFASRKVRRQGGKEATSEGS